MPQESKADNEKTLFELVFYFSGVGSYLYALYCTTGPRESDTDYSKHTPAHLY